MGKLAKERRRVSCGVEVVVLVNGLLSRFIKVGIEQQIQASRSTMAIVRYK